MVKNYIIKNCARCNSEFNVRVSDYKRGRGIFCSNYCRAKSRIKSKVEDGSWKAKQTLKNSPSQ